MSIQQALLIFQKNFKIFVQERQWRSELIPPLICYGFLQGAKSSGNPGLMLVSVEFLPMSLLTVCRSITTMMIAEKSDRQKEVQKIMGVKQSAYVLGWFLTNFARLMLVSTFFMILTLSTGTLVPSNENYRLLSTGDTILSYYMYAFALLALQYLISALFDVPKNGGDLSMFLNIIGSIMGQLLGIQYFKDNNWIIYMLSLLPSFAYDVIPYIELNKLTHDYTYDVGDYYMMLGIDIVLYTLAYLYLDQVLPNEYGTNKHPLFLLGFNYNTDTTDSRNVSNSIDLTRPLAKNDQNYGSAATQDYSSAPYHEIFDNYKQFKKAVFVENLRKTFNGELKAVDGVTLSIYDSQILCLLGHNGAGKTTTLSLLTGLIKKDAGKIYYSGKSTDEHLDEIRTYIGICPQKDVLYDCLTIEEHLWYYGKIKGVIDQDLEQEINQAINKCQLSAERGKLAKNLSGGNRRKLCLAMALIGNSRVIFLDEPTSGMDPVSRKKIWDILIQLKIDGKCLVLTTHHLDEAEVLSERIAIMAKGKLLCVGSVDFVKRNFGIGYHLTLYNMSNTQDEWAIKGEKLKDQVRQHILDCKLNPQTANECISFQLPFDQKEQYLELFQVLESDPTIQINLMMNTLEEAFINIGMDEEAFLKKTRRLSNIQEEPVEQVEVNIHDEFAKIQAPQCLARPPQYSFMSQLTACLLKKQYAMQGKRLIVQLIVPAIFIMFGPLTSKFQNSPTTSYKEWLQVGTITCFGDTIFGISIACSSIGGALVMERQQKQKYAMNVMGCRVLPYWLAHFIYDFIVSIPLGILYIIFVYAFSQSILEYATSFILVFLCFFAYIPQAYLVSWLFSDFLVAVRLLAMIEIFIFYMIPFVIFVFVNQQWLRWILVAIFPSAAFLAGFSAYAEFDYITNSPYPFMAILIIQGIVFLGLNVLIDSRSLLAAVTQNQVVDATDQDVIQEARRVEACQDRVKACKITKTYANGYQAVKGTSFGVEAGSIFGLLGPNGAGKSTTFNMITSRLKPSSGQIFLEGQAISKGMGEVYENVGICPQFDSLFEVMTCTQHLKIWACLKGLQGEEIDESIEYFLQVMQLKMYENSLAGQLSGGNKRKLCVALALIGGTNMQFFDEPSSGVDPIARRYLWNSIQQGLKLRQSAVILTTHTMDEAESLCSKIAIQVNGKFACIGTPQHLKQKFGDGYRVTIEFVNSDQTSEIQQLVLKQFPGSEIQDESGYGKLTFKLPKQGFKFYQSFNFFLTKLQKELGLIKDFQINQATLEQVFMHFASLQEQIERDQQQLKPKGGIFKTCFGNDEDD